MKGDKKLSYLKKNLVDLESKGLSIPKRILESPIGIKIKVNGKWVLNFCSNNYLGLANHPRLKEAAKMAIDRFGIGPAAVRTIAGTTTLHIKLEKELAKFKNTQDAILFQSGFNANLATIPAIVGENDVIFSDELNHASIIDACRLSRAEIVKYNHCDINDLKKKVSKYKNKLRRLIVTDGVFSMDGDIAPLDEIVKIANKFNAIIMVDGAHGEGVLGKNGRGIVNHFNLHGKVDIEVGTMSKAFGVIGGYVAGKKIIIDWLKQRARPFLFSSAMTIPDVAACLEAIKILQRSDSLIKRLWENTLYFKEELKSLGFNIGNSQTPIIPIMLGDAKLSQEFSNKLFKEGVFAMALSYPTVPQGKARIRLIMSAMHNKNDLKKALKVFSNVGKNLSVIS